MKPKTNTTANKIATPEQRKEYRTITKIAGPLAFVSGTHPVGYGELVTLKVHGETRHGQVLDTSDKAVVVQLFEGTRGLSKQSTVTFLGESMKMPVSEDMLGRILSGLGTPIDDGPELVPDEMRDILGAAINPYSRAAPSQFIQTGISTIDVTNTLIRGQKLPIFSGAGLPHNELALQIAKQASVPNLTSNSEEARSQKGETKKKKGNNDKFVVVFAAIGITSDEAQQFITSFEETGALERSVVFLNLASDPAVERLITPRLALTAAEYFAFERGMHVLVIMTDMTNYCESLREIGAARQEIPGRRGYPGYMYTDLASIYERAGVIRGKEGSLTQLPIVTMPGDDITHPITDLTGYITEGQIVISRDLNRKSTYPPIDVLPSLSRLMNQGTGKGKTRDDHKAVADQLYALYAEGRDLRGLVTIVGEEALSERDRKLLWFSQEFEKRFVSQRRDENRTLQESLEIAWQLFREMPSELLTRLSGELKTQYLKAKTK